MSDKEIDPPALYVINHPSTMTLDGAPGTPTPRPIVSTTQGVRDKAVAMQEYARQ